MKVLGIILILVGILMMVFKEINFTTTKKVVDAGPIQIDRKEDKTVGWPIYAGGVAVVAGIVILLVDRKRA
jgi:uncharacterized membrane protein YidH (DUF202 family)